MHSLRTHLTRPPAERRLLLALAAACAAMLLAALVSQYGFGLHPCALCLWQRVPYAALIALGLGVAWWAENPRALRLAGWLAALILLGEAALAFYHAGVERGIFPGPDACSGGSAPGASLEELRRQIMQAPLVPCNQAAFEWLGLSMAGWNALAAFALAVVTLFALRRMKR